MLYWFCIICKVTSSASVYLLNLFMKYRKKKWKSHLCSFYWLIFHENMFWQNIVLLIICEKTTKFPFYACKSLQYNKESRPLLKIEALIYFLFILSRVSINPQFFTDILVLILWMVSRHFLDKAKMNTFTYEKLCLHQKKKSRCFIFKFEFWFCWSIWKWILNCFWLLV